MSNCFRPWCGVGGKRCISCAQGQRSADPVEGVVHAPPAAASADLEADARGDRNDGGSVQGSRRERGQARSTVRVGAIHLTEREVEVIGLAADGLLNKEIARRLYVTVDTVKTHIRKAIAVMPPVPGVAWNRTSLVAWAVRNGVVPWPSQGLPDD